VRHSANTLKGPFNGEPLYFRNFGKKQFSQVAYGFKMADTNLRRFNEVLLLIARKNGKTTFIAGIDLAEFFLSKGGVDIVCASNTTEQAEHLTLKRLTIWRETIKSSIK